MKTKNIPDNAYVNDLKAKKRAAILKEMENRRIQAELTAMKAAYEAIRNLTKEGQARAITAAAIMLGVKLP